MIIIDSEHSYFFSERSLGEVTGMNPGHNPHCWLFTQFDIIYSVFMQGHVYNIMYIYVHNTECSHEFTTIMAATTGMPCGLFRFLKPRKPRLKNVNSCMLWQVRSAQVLKPCFETLCGTTEPQKSQKMNKQKCSSKTLDFVTSTAK